MSVPKQRIVWMAIAAGSFVAGFLVTRTAAQLIMYALEYGGSHEFPVPMIIFIMFTGLLPILAGYLAARRLMRWYAKSVSRRVALFGIDEMGRWPIAIGPQTRKWCIALVIIAYAFTWIFGAPAVQSSITKFAVDEYKRMKETGLQNVWEVHPWIRFSAAFPILPGVIATYHEYQLAGLYGFGGWEVYLWYVNGVKRLSSTPTWLS